MFVLVLCLMTWSGYHLLGGQRDEARRERDAALYEAAGLREAARISGERLAERDAIDLKRTRELTHERTQNDALRRAVDADDQRLLVNATCSVSASGHAGAGGLADGRSAELAADARSDYFTLRDQLALSRQMILGLQDHMRRVCLR
ncbi:lysis system i-spanin subunit Rz [Pseudomonas palleroniana]|nr:lysis system i-spanin subunit Rz [Pseudomonas palleroniana]